MLGIRNDELIEEGGGEDAAADSQSGLSSRASENSIKTRSKSLPSYPRLLKLYMQSTQTKRDVEPEDFLGAIAELLFLAIAGSFLITLIFDHARLGDNPIKNMVGYNNPCAFWDQPPALYYASLMFCPMVYLGFRYASLDYVRAKMTRHVRSGRWCYKIVNYTYALSQCLVMGIFVITPKVAGEHPDMPVKEMHWHMRVHSACFLQFVPVLCITMSANYIEGYMSGNPRSNPTAPGWIILAFYITATSLETIFATYAIMFYQGNYLKEGREQYFKLNPTFMMIVDYCWFVSLPLAASFQPQAPNLIYYFRLEESWRDYEHNAGNDDDGVESFDGEEYENVPPVFCKKVGVMVLLVWAHVIPFLCFVLFCANSTIHWRKLLVIAVGVPLVITCILWVPIKCNNPDDPNPFPSGICGFTINDARFTLCNYTMRLAAFAKAAATGDFRSKYGQWFADNCEDDPAVGVRFGGNTEMIYGWQACKERLESMGDRIEAGNMKRESELALTVMNNLMWPEAGKFALGFDTDDHALVRPYLASVFDNAQGQPEGWTMETLRSMFGKHFAKMTVVDHNLVTRNLYDVVNPTKSKTIVTQMILQVLHHIAFGVSISAHDAAELAALQTTQLLPAVCPASVTKTLWMWSVVGDPARNQAEKWIKRYKVLIQKKWPGDDWDDRKLDLLGSAFLDTFLQAGGRSVPLAIDLVLGYILSTNRPPCLTGVDFRQPDNIRMLMMECMRYHPPVTVLPTWVQGTEEDNCEWKHELICLDRACADPDVFPEPDEFRLDRDAGCSMAWGDFAYVGGDKAHPHSHGCPGKELSINTVIAFVLEYQAAGFICTNDDIKFNYYGTTSGFKCVKKQL